MEKKRKIKIVITTPMSINLEIFTIQVNSLVKNITIFLTTSYPLKATSYRITCHYSMSNLT